MNPKIKILQATLAFVFGLYTTAIGQSLQYQPAPADNPLKGLVPQHWWQSGSSRPHSMEFMYFPLRDLMSGPTTFNWSALDTALNGAASRGNQLIFRVYLDYPGRSTGVPQYLINGGLLMRSYTQDGGGQSPDYANANLRTAVKNFISALGSRYDGDARLAFMQIGLLGLWGEWHVYFNETWMASNTVQDEVLASFRSAFQKTPLMVSGDAAPRQVGSIGYYHDSFAYFTLGPVSWHFVPEMTTGGNLDNWKTHPIGGEPNPTNTACMFDSTPCGQNPDNSLTATHASWLTHYEFFRPENNVIIGAKYDRAVAFARKLGYEFHVTTASLSHSGGKVQIALTLKNTGNAPFYYDWPLELRVINASGAAVSTVRPTWKLTGLLPGAQRNLTHEIGLASFPANGKVLLRAVHPLSNGKPLRFANQTQDADASGWLTLGGISAIAHNTTYRLRSEENGHALHDADQVYSNNNAGNYAITFPLNTSFAAQKWRTDSVGSGWWRLHGIHRSRDLHESVQTYSTDVNGKYVISFARNSTMDCQQWKIVSVGNGNYRLENRLSGKVLHRSAETYSPNSTGRYVISYPYNGWSVQHWSFESAQ